MMDLQLHMRLFKRYSGIWYVEFQRGKARSFKTKDKSKALRTFKKLERELLEGRLVQLDANNKISLSEFMNEYITFREDTHAENTVRIDRESFNKMNDFMGDTQIHMIAQKRCDEFVKYLQKDLNLKPVTVNIAIRHLKAAFNKAIEWSYVEKNPFMYVKQLKIKDSLPKTLTIEEVESLLAAIDNKEFKELVYTSLYTGGRRTELAKLRWQDIKNLDGNKLLMTLRHTKTDTRIIPVADKLKDILFYRRKDLGFIFPSYHINPKKVSKVFRKYADKAGLLNVRFHSLRHTAGTFMILKNINPRIVQQILGHSSIKTTEIYTKLVVEYLKEGVDALDF